MVTINIASWFLISLLSTKYPQYSDSTPISSTLYSVVKDGSDYRVLFNGITSGDYYAVATATESSYYTFYDFTMAVE